MSGKLAQVDVIGFAGAQLKVSRHGATVLSWSVDGQQLLDGYRSAQEFDEYNGVRCGVLAPWSNRIKRGIYTWEGDRYSFHGVSSPLAERHGETSVLTDGDHLEDPSEDLPEVSHGLVYDTDWELVAESASTLVYHRTVEPSPAYPYRLAVEAFYQLDRDESGDYRLNFKLTATNCSEKPAPIGLGWHPYFSLGEVAKTTVSLPVKQQVESVNNIPLPGQEAFVAAKPLPSPLADQQFDTAFTCLEAGAAVITGPDGRVEISANLPTGLSGEGIWHIFTGDPLGVRPRQAVALEPCQFMTNAYNRPELATALKVAPGNSRTLQISCKFVPTATRQ